MGLRKNDLLIKYLLARTNGGDFVNKVIVRLQQVELVNFKNVENGTIAFSSYSKKEYESQNSEIIGLYGQNGSGKTALIDALWVLKTVMQGQALPTNIHDYILQSKEYTQLKAVFHMERYHERYLVFYEFQIDKAEDNSVMITKEHLSFKKYLNGEWKSKANIIDSDFKSKQFFKPKKNYKMLIGDDAENKINLGVSKKMSENNLTSFIFSSETEEIIKKSNSFKEYRDIIRSLKEYVQVNLFVIKNANTEMNNIKFTLSQGDLGIGLLEPTIVPKKTFRQVDKLIKQMNIVIQTIIPGLVLDIKNYGNQLQENGCEGVKIELVSQRDQLKIPLRYESDGIKKIVSILSTMITMYNNPSVCMVIDELDAGIFEYLLGEILQIINESGKGQLIFTSHNLRPLEMLETDSLIFTTTNPSNRYIRFNNVKSNHNLRNLYYRSLNIGGQKESIYKETNSFEISHSFRMAGRVIDED